MPKTQHATKPEFTTVTAPSYWASALINGDESGLRDYAPDPDDIEAYEAFLEYLEGNRMIVIDIKRDKNGEVEEPRFTWYGKLHHASTEGCEVVDYVVQILPK